jgi:anti-sigma B factor antagonist
MPEVRLPVEVVRGVPVVTAPDEIDITNAAALRAALLEAAAHRRGAMVADMSGTQFCDSAALHVLVRAHKRARAEGGELLPVVPATTVLRIFAITGIDRMIPNFSSLEDALAAHHPPAELPAATQTTQIQSLTGPSRPGSRKPAANAAPLLDRRRMVPRD